MTEPGFDPDAILRKMNSDPASYGPDVLPGLHREMGIVGEPGKWRYATPMERLARVLGRKVAAALRAWRDQR